MACQHNYGVPKRTIHASGLKTAACTATSGKKIVNLNSQQLIQRESCFTRDA